MGQNFASTRSPDFYANLRTRFVGRFGGKSRKFTILDNCYCLSWYLFCFLYSKIERFSIKIWLSRLAKSSKIWYFWIRSIGRIEHFLDSAKWGFPQKIPLFVSFFCWYTKSNLIFIFSCLSTVIWCKSEVQVCLPPNLPGYFESSLFIRSFLTKRLRPSVKVGNGILMTQI